MSSTRINVDAVKNAKTTGNSAKETVASVKNGIYGTKNGTDGRVLGRNNIAGRFDSAYRTAAGIESQIAQIISTVNYGASKYDQTEGNLVSLASVVTGQAMGASSPNGTNSRKDSEAFKDSKAPVDTRDKKVLEGEQKGMSPKGCEMDGDPINMTNGNFVYDHEDLYVDGEIPLEFHRYYNALDKGVGSLGRGFVHNYEMCVICPDEGENSNRLAVRLSDGQVHYFERYEGKLLGLNSALETLEETDGGYVFIDKNRVGYGFDQKGRLIRKEDLNQRGICFTYEGDLLTEARSDNGDAFTFCYEGDRLVKVMDQTGRAVLFAYEKNSSLGEELCLTRVSLPMNTSYEYEYEKNGCIHVLINTEGVDFVNNRYDEKNRVICQTFADGSQISLSYEDSLNQVVLTERNGARTTYVHDDRGRNVITIFPDGSSEKYRYNNRNLCISKIDRRGNERLMAYDIRGNLTQVIEPSKRKINMTYDVNDNLLTLSINGKECMKNSYDAKGNLLWTSNALKETTAIEYDDRGRGVKLIYPNGSIHSYSYDAKGNLLTDCDDMGTVISYEYDELNRVIKSVDANGHATSYSYDEKNQLIKVIDAAGQSRSYEYDGAGRLKAMTDYDGHSIHMEYGKTGKLTRYVDKEGVEVTFTYDALWNLATEEYENGEVIQYFYDAEGRKIRQVNGDGGELTFSYDENGNCVKTTDAMGNETSYTYDAMDRAVEKVEANGGITRYLYDADGNLIKLTDAVGNETHYAYDILGRRIAVTNAVGQTVSLCYNKLGKVERICYPNGGQISYDYDKSGRLLGVTNPDGSKEKLTLDPKGNVICRTNALGEEIQIGYDALDRVISITNPMGGVRSFAYDALGNMTRLIDELGEETLYKYSPNGNLLWMKDAMGGESNYTYDSMGHLLTSELKGQDGELSLCTYEWGKGGQLLTAVNPLGDSEHYEYDLNGRMTKKTDRDGFTTLFNYYPAGELKEILYGDGRSAAFAYNAMHQLKELKDWLGTTRIELDQMGNALSVTDAFGEKISYEWDEMGQKAAIIYPDGSRASYAYNKALQLVNVTYGEESLSYEYDALGRMKERKLSEGTKTCYEYNALGRIEKLSHMGPQVEDTLTYGYDLAGNKILAKGESEFTYQYDGLNRLTSVNRDGLLLRSYSYDAFGNRSCKKDYGPAYDGTSPALVTSYGYNENNQLLWEEKADVKLHYSYDKRGNLKEIKDAKGICKEFHFDAANQLTGVTNHRTGAMEAYSYNGFGHRMTRLLQKPGQGFKRLRYSLDMTRQVDNLLSMREDASGVKNFLWGNELVLMKQEESFFYTLDDLGSPRDFFSRAGKKESYRMDEFGLGFESKLQPFGFTGYQKDEASDLYFAQARRYDQSLGRFISEDIMQGILTLPYSLNHYNYCWNRPLDLVDENGMWPNPFKAIKSGIDSAVDKIKEVGSAVANKAKEVATAASDFYHEHERAIKTVALGAATIVGAVGATVVLGPVAGPIVAGAIMGAGMDAAVQYGATGKINMKEVVISGVAGAALGGVSAACGAFELATATKVAINAGANAVVGYGSSVAIDVLANGQSITDPNVHKRAGINAGLMAFGSLASSAVENTLGKHIANKAHNAMVNRDVHASMARCCDFDQGNLRTWYMTRANLENAKYFMLNNISKGIEATVNTMMDAGELVLFNESVKLCKLGLN